MRVFSILESRHKGKHINVTKYKKTASGIEIEVKHNIPTTHGKQLRWVQTVTENGTFYKACGRRTAVDPFSKSGTVALPCVGGVCKADDLKPFYWTDAEFSGGSGPFFYDKPSESKPAKGLLRCATFDMIRCKFRGMASLGIWAKLTVPFRVLPCQLWNGTLMNSFNILKLLAKKKRLLAVKQ